MRIEERRVKDVLIIDMNGRLDSPSVPDAEDALLKILESKDGRVLLNLEKVQYVTSVGLRLIMRLAKLLQENNRELTICNARGLVKEALDLFNLPSLIKTYETQREAFAAFQIR